MVSQLLDSITTQRWLALLVQLGGLKARRWRGPAKRLNSRPPQGSLAVGLAFLLHLDAFGGAHVDWADAAVGLACAAPVYAFDAALMLPSWRAGGVGAGGVQVVEFGDVQPTGGAEPSAGFWGGLESAAALFQRLKVTRNPAAGMSPPQELALILVAHAADEMLARAVLLGGLAAWWRDRGIEADLPQLPPAEVAQWAPWFALGLVLLFELGRRQQALTRQTPLGAALVSRDAATGKTSVKEMPESFTLPDPAAIAGPAPEGTSAAATAAAAAQLARLQTQVAAAQTRTRTLAQIDAVRELADVAAHGAAFVLTHNLFSSFVASVAADAAFSFYQRLGAARLRSTGEARRAEALGALRVKAAARAREEGDEARARRIEAAGKGKDGKE